MTVRPRPVPLRIFLPVGVASAWIGCSIPKVVDQQTVAKMLPGTMLTEDLEVACISGAALGPLVGSLGKAPAPESDPKRAWLSLVLTGTSAGMCADFDAWEAELARGRLLFELRSGGSPATAHYVADQLEVEKRIHEVAARRYVAAWNALGEAFPDVTIGEACPAMQANEEALYLLGLSSGVLAVVHDRATGGRVNVPTDLPRRVERGAACLAEGSWWGLPSAMQAAVWAAVPGATPEGRDALQALEAAARVGEAQGVRLARAFQVQTLATLGEQAALQAAVTAHAASFSTVTPDPAWRLLDTYATRMIQHESDKVWTAATGSRTPMGSLGAFPGVDAAAGEDPLDDLLNAVLPPAPDVQPPVESP